MTTGLDEKRNGHEQPEAIEETAEELQTVRKKLSELKRGDGQLISLGKQELSLLKQMLHAPDANVSPLTQILLVCDFLNDEEADDVLNAYYEAERLGMDTRFNIDYALKLAATNRKGAHQNSRVASIMHTLNTFKYSGDSQVRKHGNSSPRSPLD